LIEDFDAIGSKTEKLSNEHHRTLDKRMLPVHGMLDITRLLLTFGKVLDLHQYSVCCASHQHAKHDEVELEPNQLLLI
jgi:hypothetical protein